MGKVPPLLDTSTAEMNQNKKKKGRPPKNPLSTPPNPINYDSTPNRRSNPRNLNSPPPEFDDDDERKEKKVKLVFGLPQLQDNRKINQQHSRDYESNSNSGPGDREVNAKKRKINAVDRGSEDAVSIQKKKAVKETHSILHGSPLDSGPTAPLPDKKLLLFILDRLQKKDTYGVFAEPVDPDELPEYYEVIEQPMDFGTVRKKLDDGAYKNLAELEADVFLICANAMQFNAPDTVYYRQANSIKEIAKRDFENLKHEGDDGEPQPKVVRRGRPPSNKNQKKLLETSPAARVGPELSTVATHAASTEDKPTGSNSYNLRKGPTPNRFRPNNPYAPFYRTRNDEYCSEWFADWNDEFPASILRADMKNGKKQFTVDENRRDTYRQNNPKSSENNSCPLSNFGEAKNLVPVGLDEPLAYARSLARYAANLGPVAWKVASRKIKEALPPAVQYGPGWVAEIGSSSQPLSFSTENPKSSNSTAGVCNSTKVVTPPTSDFSYAFAQGMLGDVVEKSNYSQNEIISAQGGPSSWINQYPVQHKPVYQFHENNNGFSGFSGYPFVQARESGPYREAEMLNFGKSLTWQPVPMQQQRYNHLMVAPDLNLRIAAVSPSSSSLQIGSSQQPNLSLQL